MKLFDTVGSNRQKRTAFNLSHDRKMSAKMGGLYPILCEEVVPGDSFNIKTQTLTRLAPLVAPLMHNVNSYIHYFFVPNRLLWAGWEDFITGESAEAHPVLTQRIYKGSLGDHLGLPIEKDSGNPPITVNAFPFRAYNLIYNEYYRDQNLEEEVGLNSPFLRYRAWEKDYFTSALPWTQKGGEGIIPINSDVSYKTPSEIHGQPAGVPYTGEVNAYEKYLNSKTDGTGSPLEIHNIDTVEGQITINEFRIAHRIQKWFERQARAGSRYTETILSHFGVKTGDARLNRPEYLGGGVQPIVISEVLNMNGQTPPEGATPKKETEVIPQGHMSGHGISVGMTNNAHKSFTEHGFILGIMSVIPRTAYQGGLHKMWFREDKFDYYWPEFAHLGEQEVFNKELLFTNDPEQDNGTFGYQSRFAEYKYHSGSVHGDMRDNLNFYHAGRIFDPTDPPKLNKEFVKCDTSAINERIFAVGNEADQLWIQIYHNITAYRPMPYYGTPTL